MCQYVISLQHWTPHVPQFYWFNKTKQNKKNICACILKSSWRWTGKRVGLKVGKKKGINECFGAILTQTWTWSYSTEAHTTSHFPSGGQSHVAFLLNLYYIPVRAHAYKHSDLDPYTLPCCECSGESVGCFFRLHLSAKMMDGGYKIHLCRPFRREMNTETKSDRLPERHEKEGIVAV